MQTQCPHCDTRFRVTESQVNAADGLVRCSVCEEVFNAFEVAERDEHQPSLLSVEQPHEDPPQTPDDEAAAEQIIKQAGIEQAGDDETDQNEYDLSAPEDPSAESLTAESHEQIDEASEQGPTSETVEELDKNKNIDFNKTAASDESRKDAFDFFNEDDNESLSHVVPEQFKHSYTSDSGGFISNLLWGIGSLLLIATLALEYAWFNRDQLNQIPQLQAWTEKLCQRIECRDIAMRNPAKIELISRNVYSHPNEKNALMVDITMKNLASFAQPYPVMQIKFSDVRGGNVAARRFLPNEYLPAEILQAETTPPLFEADTNMSFTMEIQDPGKQAMTYEFDFL